MESYVRIIIFLGADKDDPVVIGNVEDLEALIEPVIQMRMH